MIKHIVLFQMNDTLETKELQAELSAIKSGLESLLGKVPSLRSIEVGINCNNAEKYSLSLTTTFDDMEGLQAYATNPDHLAVSGRIRAILASRACVDYVI